MLDSILNPYYLYILSLILINILLSLSIYITLATGQLSLGNAGFMGIGAYSTALLTIHLHLPVMAAVILSSLIAGVVGLIVGIPALRLKGIYLAIATLGFGEVVRSLFIHWESVTKGSLGIVNIPQMGNITLEQLKRWRLDPHTIGMPPAFTVNLIIFLILLGCASLIILFFHRQSRSRIGRAFSAIRMDEKAAEAMGINTTYYKVLAMVESAMVAGLAGALFAHTTAYISPADFTYHRSIEILIFAVLGGSEFITGPILGAIILTSLPELLRFLREYRYILYGIILVLIMAFSPQGLYTAFVKRFSARQKEENHP